MIADLLKEPAVLTLIGTCFSGLCAVAVAWINRNKPPRIPPALIPIILLIGGVLPGLVFSSPLIPQQAKTCDYDNCEKKTGCRCVSDQCRCGAADELAPPRPPKKPIPPRKPTSSLAVALPVMAGRPWGWFMEPLQSEPLTPSL